MASQPKDPAISQAALEAFEQIACRLGLSKEQQLTLLAPNSPNFRDRLGWFLVSYELAGKLIGSAEEWFLSKNSAPLFRGMTPIEVLLAEPYRLKEVWEYLRGVHGGWA